MILIDVAWTTIAHAALYYTHVSFGANHARNFE